MQSKYRANSTPDRRKVRSEVVVLVIVLAISVFSAVYLFLDINNNDVAIDETKNRGTITEVLGVNDQSEIFTENNFEIRLPAGWKRVNNPEILSDGENFYPYRFQGIAKEEVGKMVDVYVNRFPTQIGVNRVMLVEITEDGERIVVNEISPYCYSFSKESAMQRNLDHFTLYKEHEFYCHPSGASNRVAVIQKDMRDGVTLTKGGIQESFLIILQDHGSYQNDSELIQYVESLRISNPV